MLATQQVAAKKTNDIKFSHRTSVISNVDKDQTKGDTTRRSNINSASSFTPDQIHYQQEEALDELI